MVERPTRFETRRKVVEWLKRAGQTVHEVTSLGETTEKDVATCLRVVGEAAKRIGIELSSLSREKAFRVKLPKGPVEVVLFPEPDKPPAILIKRLTSEHVYENINSRVSMVYLIDNRHPSDSLWVVKYHETPGRAADWDALTQGKLKTTPYLYRGFATPSEWDNGFILSRKLAREFANNPGAKVLPVSVPKNGRAFLKEIREVGPIYCY